MNSGPARVFDACDGGERHALTCCIRDVELTDILGASSVLAVRLDVDLPLAAEPIEVVHERAAHERLHGSVDVGQIHALSKDARAVHVDVDLRDVGQKRGVQARQFGAPPRRRHEPVRIVREELDVSARAVLQHERDASGRADAGDRWGWKRERHALDERGEVAIQTRLNRVGRRPLSPGLEGDEEEAVVGCLHLAEQVESDHARVALHSGRVLHDLFDLARRRVGALQGRGVGQLQRDERVALILLREKRRGHATRDEERACRDEREEQQHDRRSPDQQAGDPDVTLGRCREDPIEASESTTDQSPSFLAGPQQLGGEGRAQCECVERREDHRQSDGQGELLKQPPADAWNERGRYEHRRQDQRDRDHGRRHLVHGFQCRVVRCHALIYVALDRLDDDDRVVDHEPDRQHEAKERQRVDGKAEQGEERERADQRHRYGGERNQRRAHILEEDEHDERHEPDGDEQRRDDLTEAFPHRLRRVQRTSCATSAGKRCFNSSISLRTPSAA